MPPSCTPSWRPGVAFHDDKLYHFDRRSVVVMRLWPEMRAWRRTPATEWVHTRRHADEVMCRAPLLPGRIEELHTRRSMLVGPLSPDQYVDHHFRDSAAWARALATVPDRARTIAARFGERRWQMLAMMARCPGAADLLEANPALGFALASPWILHQPAVRQPMRSIRALLRHRQARIQDWLGFPPTERVRRLLRRIAPNALSGRLLPSLRRGLRDDAVTSLLAHLPCLSQEVLRWTLWPTTRQVATPAFLHELAAIPPVDPDAAVSRDVANTPPMPAMRLWRDGVAKCVWLGREMPARLRSLAQLRRWHADLERAVAERLERSPCEILTAIWATPPWPGTVDIQPLVTESDLREEGRTMKHCVEMYAARVALGDYAVYRVQAPVRATLGLRRRGAEWIFDQLQGSSDEAPGLVTRSLLRDALDWLAPDESGATA